MSSIPQMAYDLSATPYPAWALSAGLVATPLIRPPTIPIPVEANSSMWSRFGAGKKYSAKYPGVAYPTNMSCLLFGATSALGGYMIYDNDLANGSGFLSVWSLLYPMVNARKALWSFKVWPKVLVIQAFVNTAIYGRRFIWQ